MSEPQLPREVRRRLAIIRHAEEVTGNVAMTCRYYGISPLHVLLNDRVLSSPTCCAQAATVTSTDKYSPIA